MGKNLSLARSEVTLNLTPFAKLDGTLMLLDPYVYFAYILYTLCLFELTSIIYLMHLNEHLFRPCLLQCLPWDHLFPL